jgi:hypothetical protein
VGEKISAFQSETALLFYVVTLTSEGHVHIMTEIHEIGDLATARKYWREAVKEHPEWHHTIQLGNGTDVLRNDPLHKGKRPKEVWISKIHRRACKTCYLGNVIPSSGGGDGVCTTCGPVRFDPEAQVWF